MKSRTIQIIEKGGSIFVKSDRGNYLRHVDLVKGPDGLDWTRRSGRALEMFNLKWAHAIASLVGGKVVVVYPKASVIKTRTE